MFVYTFSCAQTPNGEPWEVAGIPYVNGTHSQQVKDLLVHNDRLIACGQFELYYTDDGVNWSEAQGIPFSAAPGYTGDNQKMARLITVKNDTLILNTDVHRYYYSIDNAATWIEFPNSFYNNECVQLFTSPDNTKVYRFFGPKTPYMEYSYNGENWLSCIRDDGSGNGDAKGSLGFNRITTFKDTLYAIGLFVQPGQIPQNPNANYNTQYPQLYKSIDGITWSYVNTQGLSNVSGSRYTGIFEYDGNLYISSNGLSPDVRHYYKSNDGINFEMENLTVNFNNLVSCEPYLVGGVTDYSSADSFGGHGICINKTGLESDWNEYAPADGHTPFTSLSSNQMNDAVLYKDHIYVSNYSGLFKMNVNKILSTKSIEGDNFTSIYPNPTNSVLNIAAKTNTNIKIVSVLGTVVSTQQLHTGNNTIDVSNLVNGIYFIQDANGGAVKFIKE